MRFMMLVKHGEIQAPPPKEFLDAMAKLGEEAEKSGNLIASGGLSPIAKSARVRLSRGRVNAVDGPFAEAKELIAGFWLWQVKSMEEAVEWLKRAPFDGTEVEIRQVFEVQDFPAEVVTPEHAARMQALREELKKKAAKP